MTTINGYRIYAEVLGVGSFGEVRAGCLEANEAAKVAIKVASRKILTPKRLSQLRREISILRELNNHPRVIKLLDVQEDKDNIYLIFEKKTTDLYNLVQHVGRMNEMQAGKIFSQLVDVVDFCHSRSYVHRDVKLENILIDLNSWEIALADFGFACSFKGKTNLRKWCGSPHTVAPEIILRTPYLPQPVDIWALGSVLFTMLNGKFPFQAPNLPEILTRTREGIMHDFLPHISVSARDIIMRMLNTDPTRRITLNQIKEHPWFRFASTARISAFDSMHRKRPVRRPSRHKAKSEKAHSAVILRRSPDTRVQLCFNRSCA